MTAARAPLQAADARHQAAARRAVLRVTGVLADDAQLYPTTGQGAMLMVRLQPAQGLPYEARLDLGLDLADHMAARADLPRLKRGVLMSVAGDALELRTDHGQAVLRVVRARDAVAFFDPTDPTVPQEG